MVLNPSILNFLAVKANAAIPDNDAAAILNALLIAEACVKMIP